MSSTIDTGTTTGALGPHTVERAMSELEHAKTDIEALQTSVAAPIAAVLTHVTIAIPLATIQAKTSGTAFNIGSALPANAQLLGSAINVTTTVTGGTISACTMTVQNTGETAGAIQASKSVFTATGRFNTAGSNPYQTRGAQQLQATLTATGDTLANATTGVLAVELFYAVLA